MRSGHVLAALVTLALTSCGTSVDPDGGAQSDSGADAGPPVCTNDGECDDGVDCTADTCTIAIGTCRHQVVPALCPAGSSCHPVRGCEMGRACASDEDCTDDDACTVNERCAPAARVCVVDPLDGDMDGDPPRVCGGGDCDDSDANVFSGAEEVCNDRDDDCDGMLDEGVDPGLCAYCHALLTCCTACTLGDCYTSQLNRLSDLGCSNSPTVSSSLGSCPGCDTVTASEHSNCREESFAMCACPDSETYCTEGGPVLSMGACHDLQADDQHCGTCGNACPSGASCVSGACRCPGGMTACGDSCVDTATSVSDCGSCDNACPPTASCVAGSCTCPAGQTVCGSECVDTMTSPDHCGRCDRPCGTCRSGACFWEPRRCPLGFADCGGENVCVSYDPLNCGTCGTACPSPTPFSCQDGVCR